MVATISAIAQELRINVTDKPLDRVLTDLDIEISFDSKALSTYNITLDKSFRSPGEALGYLLRGKPYTFEKTGNVYIIYPLVQTKTTSAAPVYFFSGILSDSGSGELLPYGYISAPDKTVATDEKGYFTFTETSTGYLNIKIRYLGFMPKDTVLQPGHHHIALTARTIMMDEIVITSSPGMMLMQSGQRSGENRINHNVARYMPGSSDNSVFTLLRMMPGVRASGEPTEELITRGTGSKVTFDGFTLFGMRGFNDNISFVNPYMTKDIRLMKNGYDASYGNQTGAIAEISGMEGNTSQAVFKANAGTLTANIYGSIPVSKRSVLSAAYRQTFYNLYESELLNPFNGKKSTSTGRGNGSSNGQGHSTTGNTEIFINPDYTFRDLNIKYAGTSAGNNHYYISLYGASDKFDYTATPDPENDISVTQRSLHAGAAAGFDKTWNQGSVTRIRLNYSGLSNHDEHMTISSGNRQNTSVYTIENSAGKSGVKISHEFHAGSSHKLIAGSDINHYLYRLNDLEENLTVPSVHITDYFGVGRFSVDAGLRADYISGQISLQPRISLRQKFAGLFTATASWGMYNEFFNRVPVIVDEDKLALAWKLHDLSRSMNTMAGIAFNPDKTLISAEIYLKQFRNAIQLIDEEIVTTGMNIRGMEIFAKQHILSGELFGSFTLQQALSPTAYTAKEYKAGGLYNFRHFTLSANYVYGTGFPAIHTGGSVSGNGQGSSGSTSDEPYSRLDIALTYRLRFRSGELHTGASIVNLLNNANTKYNYITIGKRDPVALYSQAMPFTPVLFAEIIF